MNERLVNLRKNKGLSLRDVEKATGIDNSCLSAMEHGRRRVNVRVGTILADFYNVSLDYLLGLDFNSTLADFEARLQSVVNEYEGCPKDENPEAFLKLACIKKILSLDYAQIKIVAFALPTLSAISDFDREEMADYEPEVVREGFKK